MAISVRAVAGGVRRPGGALPVPRGSRPRPGFALIIVLALLSLLVLLVLTLTTQLQLSLLGTKQAVRQEQARQNAKFALSVALAQLQRQAGPDQRVTARADVMINSQQQAGLPPNSAQMFWTGVWKTHRQGATSQELDTGTDENNAAGGNLRQWSKSHINSPAADGTQGDSNSFLVGGPQWLVSWPGGGSTLNPRTGPSPNPGIRDREVAATNAPAFKTLARVVDPLTGNLHHVRAWKVPLLGQPAIEGGGVLATGAYAYWISDEGVKAKANLVSPWPSTNGSGNKSSNYAENQLNFQAPQRMAIEKMLVDPRPGVNPLTAARLAVPPPADPRHSRLALVQSLADLAVFLPAGAVRSDGTLAGGAPGARYTFNQRFFPDVTTVSYGVLSDVRRGGLKVDLTAAFENQSQYSGGNNSLLDRTRRLFGDGGGDEKVYRAGYQPAVPSGVPFNLNGLRWDTLFLYYNLYKERIPSPLGATAGPFLGPRNGPEANPVVQMRAYKHNNGVTESALLPRMLDMQLYFGFGPGPGNTIEMRVYPSLVLYNPYNVTLDAPAGYQFQLYTNMLMPIRIRNASNLGSSGVSGGGDPFPDPLLAVTPGSNVERQVSRDGNGGEIPRSGSPAGGFGAGQLPAYRFVVMTDRAASLKLEPGEVRVYGLSAQTPANAYAGFITNLTDQIPGLGSSIYQSSTVKNMAASQPSGTVSTFADANAVQFQQAGIYSNAFGYYTFLSSNAVSWPNPSAGSTRYLGRFSLRGFNSPSGSTLVPMNGQFKEVGGLGFWVKGTRPRNFSRTPYAFDNVNRPMPAVPMFASVHPLANPLAVNYDGIIMDYISEMSTNPLSGDFNFQLQTTAGTGPDGRRVVRARWGVSTNPSNVATPTEGQTHVILRDVPRQPMASLGQFMHATNNYWVTDDPDITYPGFEGALLYGVGGSLAPATMVASADANINRTRKVEYRTKVQNATTLDSGLGSNFAAWIRDENFLANEALFDSYFLSTVPAATRDVGRLPPVGKPFNAEYVATGQALPNSRLKYYFNEGAPPPPVSLQNLDRAAASLMLDGAFNINSTSVDAWVALLSSMSGYDLRVWNTYEGGKKEQTLSATTAGELKDGSPVLRVTAPVVASGPLATHGITKTGGTRPFESVRVLTDAEVRDLAQKIVEQVKLRGPFLSVADFLNRRLSPDSRFNTKGALQAAIDNTTINNEITVRAGVPLTAAGMPASGPGALTYQTLHAWQGNTKPPRLDFGDTRLLFTFQLPVDLDNLPSSSAVGIPGYLMQQDLVQAFSPVMTARSDTFIIRTYGESSDPVTGEITGRAYLEAVVQRFPDFVDPSVAPETRSRFVNDPRIRANALADVAEPGVNASTYNPQIRVFGRKFRVVSLRWLNENEI